jgi:glycosyltransferase involved in cell wall biosynthesis
LFIDKSEKGKEVGMNWCVVIPAYNNEKTLETVLQDVLQITDNIIVINDGSTDNTLSVIQRFNSVQSISYSRNRGKGYALMRGFEKAVQEGYSYAVTMDADGQHLASDLHVFLNKLADYPDSLIVGTRGLPAHKMRFGSRFANNFSNFWFRLISGVHLPDTQSGYRLYPLNLLKEMHFYTHRYEFEIEILVRAAWKGIHITDVPITVYYPPPEYRISHFRPVKDFIRISLLNTILVIMALFWVKPFSFMKYLKKENILEFIKKHVLHSGDSIPKIAFSVMLGIFMGIAPIWGYQLITAITLAYLFRLNKFIVIMAANISIPPMIPPIIYLSYLTGGWILNINHQIPFSRTISFDSIKDNLIQYIVGSLVFGCILSLCSGIATFILLKFFRKKRSLIS